MCLISYSISIIKLQYCYLENTRIQNKTNSPAHNGIQERILTSHPKEFIPEQHQQTKQIKHCIKDIKM